MAKSRIALWLVAGLIAAPLRAQPDPAEALVERQRAELRAALRLDCRRPGDDSEIVVCGSREPDRQHRLEPSEPTGPPRAADQAGGEQRAAMAAGASTCTPVGRDQRCTGGLDVIGIGFTIARAVAQALMNRD